MLSPKVKTVAMLMMTFVVLTACAHDKSKPSTNGSSADTPAAAPTKIYSESDFDVVCNGIGVKSAAKYELKAGEVSPVYVFDREDKTKSYSVSSTSIPEQWKPAIGEYEKAQLIVCLTATERTLAQTCEFNKDEEEGAYILETYNTKYDAVLYEAQSGKELAKTNFDLQADAECPYVHFFREKKEIDDANYEQAVTDFIKPFVQTQ